MWFNRMAARLLNLRRTAISACASEPAARAGVRALPGATGLHQPGGHPQRTPEDCYLSLQVAPYGDGQLLLLVSDVSRRCVWRRCGAIFVANASQSCAPPHVISGYLETLGQDPALDPDLTDRSLKCAARRSA